MKEETEIISRPWSFVAGACCGGLAVVFLVATCMKEGHATSNAREWMHEQGLHPTVVTCSRDKNGNGYGLCTFYVPQPLTTGDVAVQIFECETVALGKCREPESFQE